jgi:hypothetical protein
MLEQLFGSRTRVLLLRLFLDHEDDVYFVREITRLLGSQVNSVRRELENLESFGLLKVVPAPSDAEGEDVNEVDKQKKYYGLNKEFVLYTELRSLFLKARLLIEKDLVERMQKLGRIQYLALTGLFVGLPDWPTDIFIVGQVTKEKIKRLIRHFEKELQQEINYTVMTKQEFLYRREVTDRFIFSILENKKIVVIDTISEKHEPKKGVRKKVQGKTLRSTQDKTLRQSFDASGRAQDKR